MTETIALIGMMGAGKSTIGRLLAARLGWTYVDSDEQVEARTGRTVREIFEADGEATFRSEESLALEAALDHGAGTVFAVAGGAVLAEANRNALRDRCDLVVWLRAAPGSLERRVVRGDHRPLLAKDPSGTLERLDRERRPLYEALADLVVDTDELSPEEVVATIVEAMR